MCCVFAANDCVYCEPDGTTRASDDPPAGGELSHVRPLRTLFIGGER